MRKWSEKGGRKMEKMIERRARGTGVVVLAVLILIPFVAMAQQDKDPMMGRGMTGGGMGPGMMGPGGMPMMRMMRPPVGLMGLIHRWQNFLIAEKVNLGLTAEQLDKIESILSAQRKVLIRKNADRKVLLVEIQELLLKEKVDLNEVEKKVKAMEATFGDMIMERARAFETALAVLTPEQRKKAVAFFKESTFPGAMRMRARWPMK
jgi:Spy/CpxP family protein refolding chaperone